MNHVSNFCFLIFLDDKNHAIFNPFFRFINMKRKKGFLYILIGGMATAFMVSCADDESFSSSRTDLLSFSTDTVSLDTTFSNVPTPTRSFWVYNRTGKGLRCSSVRLENGNQTGYRVNVDGSFLGQTAGFQTQNVEVRKGDSIRVFVELTSHQQYQDEPQLVEDNLLFQLESGVQQKINLKAYSWDATLLNSPIIKKDSTIQGSRPIVIYGGMCVDSVATLTIGAGTRLFFHENAGLKVYGTLRVQGEQGKEVVMRGDRIDNMFDYLPYDRTPGQWQGIQLMASSYDNVISYADIHSAYHGILVDSCDVTRQKLLLQNSTVHNCQGYGVMVDSAKVQIYNSQLSNTLEHPLYVHGGDVEVNGCTIAQFYPFDGRRATAIGFMPPVNNLKVMNSLVTGYHDDEVVWSAPKEDKVCNFSFDHCVLRTEKMTTDDSLKFTNIIFEDLKDTTQFGEKHFRLFDTDNLKYDFRLRKESAAIGVADAASSLPTDRQGLRRDEKPDAGCYEFEEQIEENDKKE